MSDQGIIALIGLVSTGILILFTFYFRNIQNSVANLSMSIDQRLTAMELKYASIDKNDAVLMKMLDLFQRELDEIKKNCRRCRDS
jgi:hypothetical protein